MDRIYIENKLEFETLSVTNRYSWFLYKVAEYVNYILCINNVLVCVNITY